MCAAPCGQLLNSALSPLTCFSGGVIPAFCPTTPSAAQQAQPGAAGAAAQIQADTAASKARVAAVEYLATVDCHYWPEAEKTLIESLRADRNECVRFAAARALCSSCCCTKKTVAALLLTVSGDNSDGNPSESSWRVRAAASEALARCNSVPMESPKPQPLERPEPVRPEMPPIPLESVDPSLRRTDYYDETVAQMPSAVLAARARRVLAMASRTTAEPGMPPTGSRSLLDIAHHAQAPQTTPPPLVPRPDAPLPRIEPTPRSGATAPAQPAGNSARASRPEKSHTVLDVLRQSRGARDDAS
jgi:hypothetical protein